MKEYGERMEKMERVVDMTSWFYKNCRTQRRRGAKICSECPFRAEIEKQEQAELDEK